MEMVGLVSGGKDSMYNMMCAVKEGWKVILSNQIYLHLIIVDRSTSESSSYRTGRN